MFEDVTDTRQVPGPRGSPLGKGHPAAMNRASADRGESEVLLTAIQPPRERTAPSSG